MRISGDTPVLNQVFEYGVCVCVCVCVVCVTLLSALWGFCIIHGLSAMETHTPLFVAPPVLYQVFKYSMCVYVCVCVRRKEPHGGALRLFPPDAAPVDVYPHCGRLAMFLSKTVAHEVMPTVVPRHSFTLWYYGTCTTHTHTHVHTHVSGMMCCVLVLPSRAVRSVYLAMCLMCVCV